MNDQQIDLLGKLIAAVFVAIVTYLTPKIKNWLETHTSKASQETIRILITAFTQAAEQLLHDKDPDGTKRMDYVKNQLTAVGIGITSEVVSMIESAVWEINNQNKKNLTGGVEVVFDGNS